MTGRSGESVSNAEPSSRMVPESPASASCRNACNRRDLPMPGSPDSSASPPWPARARAQQPRSVRISGPRPHSAAGRARATRPCAAASRSTCQTPCGWLSPRSSKLPRSAQTKRSRTRRQVASPIATPPGGTSPCSRAAKFGAEPTTTCRYVPPAVCRSPTTTGPVAMPMRTASGSLRAAPVVGTSIAPTPRAISSAARTARSGSFSLATGKQKYARIPSPTMRVMRPPKRSIGPAQKSP